MEERIKVLAVYRLEKAQKNLEIADRMVSDRYYNYAINRAYYAVFDGMRAVNCLEGFDSSKHSGVLAHFTQFHVKTGDFDADTSVIIKKASYLREKSDYEDFFEAEEDDAREVVKEARIFVRRVKQYLDKMIPGGK